MTTQDNVDKAIKLYNSCSSKFTNMLPWSLPIPDRISTAIDLLKQCVLDYKIQKNTANQIKYSFLIDKYYDDYYNKSHDRLCKSSQASNLKELIILCDKDNKQNFINNNDIKYDIFNLIQKYMITSEETGEEYTIYSCYKFLLDFYKNPLTNVQIDFVIDIYEKMQNIKEEYNEAYPELLVSKKENYMRAGEIYEEIAKKRVDTITKFSCDMLLMKSFLCFLCTDEVLAERKLNEFEVCYPIITHTKDFKLCKNIMHEYKNKDVDVFVSFVRDYDDIKKLDDFMVNLLNKIKKNMSEEEIDLC